MCSFPGGSNAFIPLLYLFSGSIYKETSFTNLVWMVSCEFLSVECKCIGNRILGESDVEDRKNTPVRYGWGMKGMPFMIF